MTDRIIDRTTGQRLMQQPQEAILDRLV